MLNLLSLIILAACSLGFIPAIGSHWLACRKAKREDVKVRCEAKSAAFAARAIEFKRIHNIR